MEDDGTVSDQKVNIDTSHKAEFFKFLQDTRRNLDSLKNYPKVGKLFKNVNTLLTSSASAEYLLSAAWDVLTTKINRLEDAKIEKLLLLKVNKDVMTPH